ncbi:hypothetical protein PFISCL1PPCAC_17223, partial [Pristionchus fissidentatus]
IQMAAVSLPKSSVEFSDPTYWKKFFSIHRSPFEWYGDHASLGSVFDKYLKPADEILQIGCGNSRLASELHDVGYRNILSIDTNSAVITEQITRNRERSALKFQIRSATETGLGDESMNVVVDKGTLDALLPPGNEAAVELVTNMFNEVTRVLRAAGRYIIVTLAQEHILRAWVDHFRTTNQYILRIHKIDNSASGFPMPVFVFVATKMKMRMPTPMPMEFCRSAHEKPIRMETVENIIEAINGEQFLSRFVHLCSKTLTSEASIVLSSTDGNPRYKLYIVDDTVTRPQNFSVFIVPIGRDGDWLFATEKGRRSLRMQCKKDRLAIVALYRDCEYESLQEIKEELAAFVLRLNPVKGVRSERVEFLSMGDHDVKRTVASGESEMNGRWSVEDVVIREKEYRRLVFLASQNLVQSEASFKVDKSGSKAISFDELACDHHDVMLLSFVLLKDCPLVKPDKVPLKVAVLGLGGGLLAGFLIKNLAQVRVTGVELDPQVVQIATDHFEFPATDARMDVRVMDAMDYLKETALGEECDKQDVIMVDLATSMSEEGLSCPPPAFLTTEALTAMREALNENGILALNLVTRDEDISKATKEKVSKHFATLAVVSSEEDVNEVLLATKTETSAHFDSKNLMKSLDKSRPWIKNVADKIDKLMMMQ